MRGAESSFRVFCSPIAITEEPTSGLEPLTSSLRVSWSMAERVVRASLALSTDFSDFDLPSLARRLSPARPTLGQLARCET
jgi:hypothetical protein